MPDWLTQLPGHPYTGPDPDGFMTSADGVKFVAGFATATNAPVRTHMEVTSVKPIDSGYHIETNTGNLQCWCLVVASGACNLPVVPVLAEALPASITCVTPITYGAPH